MKTTFKLLVLLLLISTNAVGQFINFGKPGVRVGIGVSATATTGLLALRSIADPGSTVYPIGLDHMSPNNTVRMGTVVTNLGATLRTHSNHPLHFSTYNSDTQMVLQTDGNVGIGTLFPLSLAGLVVNKKEGAVNAMFGSHTSGVAIESDWPGIGLNTYYDSGRRSIAAGYGGLLSLNMSNGNISIFTSASASNSFSPVTIDERLTITPVGGVELGENSSNNASGYSSMAFGSSNTASGFKSLAMGTLMSTNGYSGAVGLGDNSAVTSTNSTAANQFTARFAGGYRFFSNSTATIGAELPAGSNAWGTISDSAKKERFLLLNQTDLLTNIRSLKLGTWNYKGQRTERHYGPMAQEFFARFGHDDLGVIGCDTLINSHDFTAVTLSGVQALALENEQLKARITQLETERRYANARLDALERRILVEPAPRSIRATQRRVALHAH